MFHQSFLMLVIAVVCCVLCFIVQETYAGLLSEPERVAQWHRKHSWPPKWQEESPSYRALMEEREREIMQLTGADERWENWMQYVQSRLLPSFTERGFEVIQTPKHIHEKLRRSVMENGIKYFDELPEEEGVADSIYGPLAPKFVTIADVASSVHRELLPLHEAWSGVKLRPTSIYGVRLYRNGSTIVMHNDKPQTHVISSIVHIAHEYDDDNEPWHIQIEDHDGNLHSVALEEGQMMFYESAKCLHGRMHVLKGKYYGSVFIHYQPVDKKVWGYTVEDIINAVPPHWKDGTTEEHGSRWAGQAITVDSRAVDNAPPRVFNAPAPEGMYQQDDEDFYEELEAMDQQTGDFAGEEL